MAVFVAMPAGAFSNMTLQKTAEGAAEGVAPPAGLQWIYFAHHTHTDYSDGRDTVQNRILEAASFGADIVSITDHNTMLQCHDPWFIEQDGCIPMCGDEWGGMGRGHACVLNMSGDDPLDVMPDGTLYPLDIMLPQMLARGGTIFINHPFDDGNGWPEGFARAGICGVGAWTTPFPNADARGWWAGHITNGRILVAIGESDHHLEKILSTAISNSLVPCNYVLAASKQPADVQSAVKTGRISIAGSKGAARTFVWCDQDGDGVYETPMGTNIVVTQPKRLRFRAEVYDGAGFLGNIMVYSMSGGIKTTLGSGSPWRIDYEADVTSDTKDFVRAELRGAFGIFQSLSNPIYINFAPTVTLTADPANPVSGAIGVSATLSAATADFGADDIAASNATVSNFTGGGANYSFTLTPIANGLFSCFVPAERFYDGVGNPNLASATLARTYEAIVEGQPEGIVEGEGMAEGEGGPEGELEGVVEGVIEGQPEGIGEGEGMAEGEGGLEGTGEGELEGASEGILEGQSEGEEEGVPSEGQAEGIIEGQPEGSVEGALEGDLEGSIEGQPEGGVEGEEEGIVEGELEGLLEGDLEGVLEGQQEGQTEGGAEGYTEGVIEGVEEGIDEGQPEGLIEGEAEGLPEEGAPEEGQVEGIMNEGDTEGVPEGEEEGIVSEGLPEEGQAEGEGYPFHTADQDLDNLISLSELLRVIQFFNSNGFHCEAGTEDGYAPGPGDQSCAPHASDYNPQDWQINLSELLRMIQFFNSDGYHACPGEDTEDGFCPKPM